MVGLNADGLTAAFAGLRLEFAEFYCVAGNLAGFSFIRVPFSIPKHRVMIDRRVIEVVLARGGNPLFPVTQVIISLLRLDLFFVVFPELGALDLDAWYALINAPTP